MSSLSRYGLITLGSYLKKISDTLFREVDHLYKANNLNVPSRFIPAILLIKDNGQISVSELAGKLGQTHSAVSQMSQKLAKWHLIFDAPDVLDERRRLLSLTPQGYEYLDKLSPFLFEIERQLTAMLGAGAEEMLSLLRKFEQEQKLQPLTYRVSSAMQRREQYVVNIVDYEPTYAEAFKRLNVEWLEKYFYVEAIDEQVLSNPDSYIIEPGGHILIALIRNKPVGTAALIATSDNAFELSKMSVSAEYQGLGIGRKLAIAAIEYYQSSGRSLLYLESNSRLTPALALYESLGFQHRARPGGDSHYQRADVYMEYLPKNSTRNGNAIK